MTNNGNRDLKSLYGTFLDVSPNPRLFELQQVIAKTKYKECSHFQRIRKHGINEEFIKCSCVCGEFATHHREIPAAVTEANDPDCGAKIKTISPSNAFGQLAFSSNTFPYETIGGYIRLSDDDVDAAVDCLVGLEKEISTCISILTSSQPQQMHPEILNPLLDGLIEAASNSQALVLVDGFDTKPARNISKRLWMHQLRSCMRASKDETIAWAAIVSWGDVNDREMLECQSQIVKYTCDTMGDFIRPLNRYHNLFLMVDDGLRYMHPNSKIRQFRLRLEQALSDRLRESSGSQDNLSRCSIAVLVGGDYKSLLEIEARVNAGMPCVVCIGTGMAADILYLACQLSETDSDKRLTMSAYLRRRLAARLSRISDAPDDTDEAIGLISRLVSNNKLLKFCNTLNGASFAEEILKPLLLFANSPTAVARLAKLWNRPDILQSVIAKDQNALDQRTIAEMLYEAIFYNQLEFVKLLLPPLKDLSLIRTNWAFFLYTDAEESTNMTKLLTSQSILKDVHLAEGEKPRNRAVTVEMLNTLIDRILKCEIGVKIFHKMSEDSGILDEISDAIKDGGFNAVFKAKCQPLNEPIEQIFLACVFLGRFEMAEYIWGLCTSPLSLALIACRIQRRCAEIFEDSYDTYIASRYREYANNFENLATEMVTIGVSINDAAACDLVGGSYMRAWFSPIVLELAYLGDCTTFMSSLPAQKAIEYMWTCNIRCKSHLVPVCMFLPFVLLMPRFVQYGTTELFSLSHTRDRQVPTYPANNHERFWRFYNCPRVKHHFGLITFVLFVLYTSYVLFAMNPVGIKYQEIALIILFALRIVDRVLMALRGNRHLELQFVSGTAMLVYMFLRFYSTYETASTALVVCLILLYLELLFFAMNNKHLGPKVTMIVYMTREAFKFSPLFVIFVIAFGVGEYATLYPYKTGFDFAAIEEIAFIPFYQMFGVNSLELITDGNENCPVLKVGIECPMPNAFTTILVAVYVMFMGVLIMNLLIALFSYIFDNVTQQANGIWKRNRFYVTKSFHHQEIWPWPLGVSCELQRFIKEKIARHKEMKKSGNKRKNTFLSRLYMYGELELTEKPEAMRSDVLPETVVQLLKRRYMLEDHCREAILVRRKEAEEATLSAKLTQMNCELDHLDNFKESERFVRQLPMRNVPEAFEDQFQETAQERFLRQKRLLTKDTEGSQEELRSLAQEIAYMEEAFELTVGFLENMQKRFPL